MKCGFKKWLMKAGIRAMKTVAQTGITLIGSDMVNIVDLDWTYILGACATAGLLSLLFSIKGLPELEEEKTEETKQ